MSEPDDPSDEPMIGASRPALGRDDLEARIRELVTGQPYAVLCTQGGGQPYGSLIATGFTPDLRHVLFATPITTRKFRLLESSGGVATEEYRAAAIIQPFAPDKDP